MTEPPRSHRARRHGPSDGEVTVFVSDEQRQLEIAMTLATEPSVLLLDEPLAGMGVSEAENMVQLLLRLIPS